MFAIMPWAGAIPPFGPTGEPTVCLIVLKALRDMLFLVIEVENYAFWNEAVQNSHWKFIRDPGVSVISEVANSVRMWMKLYANYDEGSFIDQYSGSKRISSCTLHQTLVLLEWEQHPTNEEWSGSNMSKRLLNIIKRLQLSLKKQIVQLFPQRLPNIPK